MAFTSGELLDMPTGVIELMRNRSFLLLQSFAGAAGTGLKSFSMVATGTCGIRRPLEAPHKSDDCEAKWLIQTVSVFKHSLADSPV